MQRYTWIYSLQEELGPEMETQLANDFQLFLSTWDSHKAPVVGTIQIKYSRFIVIQADPNDTRPSGCSIDNLKRTVQRILDTHQLVVMDAGHIFFRNERGEIENVHFKEIDLYVDQGVLRPSSIVFDHSLDNSDDLLSWEVTMEQTWMRKYLTQDVPPR